MIELKITNGVQDGKEGFVVKGTLEGTSKGILEELAYGCIDIINQLPGGQKENWPKFMTNMTLLMLTKD